jgi:hypothetical protein
LKKQQSVAFQAADMLAYEHRLANIKMYESGARYIDSADLLALDDVPHGGGWAIYDFEELEKQCIIEHAPLRIA